MFNPNYLRGQLRMAADCIGRAFDALPADPAAIENPPRFTADIKLPAPESGDPAPDPLARSMALAMTIQKQVEHGRVIVALTERLDKLTKILLDIAPDACARHDLFGF